MRYFTAVFILSSVFSSHVIALTYNVTSDIEERRFFGIGSSSEKNSKQASIWLTPKLFAMFSPSYRCTGAIIGREHVLTSATCVSRFPVERLQVSEAEVNLSDSHRFDQVISMNVNYDINLAVLRVSQDFFTQSSVATLVEDKLVTGDKCISSGWNFDRNEWEQQVVSYMTSADCVDSYSSVTSEIMEGIICATPEVGNASCRESLGWQLECNGELTGLFSWNHYSCERPSVYSSVRDSIPWIAEAKGNAYRYGASIILLIIAIINILLR